MTVPGDAGRRSAGDEGCEEVVKGECECCRPRADENDLEERVGELPRSVPEAQGSTEIFELRSRVNAREETEGIGRPYVYGYHDMN